MWYGAWPYWLYGPAVNCCVQRLVSSAMSYHFSASAPHLSASSYGQPKPLTLPLARFSSSHWVKLCSSPSTRVVTASFAAAPPACSLARGSGRAEERGNTDRKGEDLHDAGSVAS